MYLEITNQLFMKALCLLACVLASISLSAQFISE
ncbi:MAG: hypothetical protein ACI87V_001039, partial [Flavobacteriales bacterium]